MKKLVVCIYLIYLNLDVYSQNILNFNKLKFGNNKEINEESSKDLYSYKTHFYNAIKQKSLENYEKALKLFLTCIELNPNESASYFEVAKIAGPHPKDIKINLLTEIIKTTQIPFA